MKCRKLTRRRSALRWLAAVLAAVVFVLAAELYCFTPEQALRKLSRGYDLGELKLLETMDGQIFNGTLRPDCKQAYVLQNQGLTCLAFGSYWWPSGWGCYLSNRKTIEHGEQPSVPVDCLMDYVELLPEGWTGSVLMKEYILGIVLDPAVETVELRLGQSNWEEDVRTFVTATTVSIPREDWHEGPYYNWFFYIFDPVELGHIMELRALDANGDPITWTNLEGELVEWYDYNWPRYYFEDGWRRLNGERP